MDNLSAEERPLAVDQVGVDQFRECIAPWWHTALVLAQLLGLALMGPAIERARRGEAHVLLYASGVMGQCLQLGAVVAGLYHRRKFFVQALRSGKSTWRSDVWRGVALYLGSLLMFAVVAKLMHAAGLHPHYDSSAIYAMLPAGRMELLMWLCLSLVVGFCEEHVFRGYLLQQAVALARGAGASPMLASTCAVALTSVLFGSLHVYEGVGGAILIGILGAMYAVMAIRQGNLRAVIVAHVLQDFMTAIFVTARHLPSTR